MFRESNPTFKFVVSERYYQEESERKAMAEQIEQMGGQIENYQKKLEELQDKYTGQVRECSDLTCRLDSTEALVHTFCWTLMLDQYCSETFNVLSRKT